MKNRIWLIAVLAMTALFARAACANLGVSDIGEKGLAVIHVADVTLKCAPGGSGDSSCMMSADGAGWSVSEDAGRVQFVIGYRFINERPVQARKFTLGYTVARKEGERWLIVADKQTAVEKNVAANSTAAGDCVIPPQKLGKTGGTFRITVRYEGCDVSAPPQTRIVSVDRVL